MLYLGRGQLAIAYYLLSILGALAAILSVHYHALDMSFQAGMWAGFFAIYVIGFVHSVVLARRLQGETPQVWFARWYWVLGLAILVPTMIASLIRWFLWEPYSIPSRSMYPVLQVGDLIYVSKFAYGYSPHSLPFDPQVFSGRILFSEPERGDIAVFKNPMDIRTDYIKRIVGLPGDSVQVKGGILQINGEAVLRTKIENKPEDTGGGFRGQNLQRYIEQLPGGARYPILEERDTGRLDNTRLFEVPEGHYFAMGDNRDNTQDSRIIGFIPRENLVGRLSLVLWNDKDRRLKFLD